jgi:hypothetical protein
MFDSKSRIRPALPDMTHEQRSSYLAVAENVERLNRSIRAAVESGLSIEYERTCRHHDETGFWGDIVSPCVVKKR